MANLGDMMILVNESLTNMGGTDTGRQVVRLLPGLRELSNLKNSEPPNFQHGQCMEQSSEVSATLIHFANVLVVSDESAQMSKSFETSQDAFVAYPITSIHTLFGAYDNVL